MEFFLLSSWLRKRTPGSRKALLVGLLVCIVLPVIQKLVVTQREQVKNVCQELVDATEQGDVDAIARRVAPEFAVREIDRDRFLEGVKSVLTSSRVENPSMHSFKVTVEDDKAEVTFVVSCRIVTREGMEPGVVSSWRVIFQRVGEEWLLIYAEPKSTPLFPFDRLEQLLG